VVCIPSALRAEAKHVRLLVPRFARFKAKGGLKAIDVEGVKKLLNESGEASNGTCDVVCWCWMYIVCSRAS
jgi:hypothetical protein